MRAKAVLLSLCFLFAWAIAIGISVFRGDEGDRERKEFLAAKTLEELSLEQKDLEPRLIELLDAAMEEAPEQIGPLALQANQLIEFEQLKNGGWHRSMWNGWTVLADMLKNYNTAVPGLEAIGGYTRIFRHDQDGRVPASGGFRFSNRQGWLRAFQAHGGGYEPREAMDRMAVDLRRVCGEGEMTYLLSTFARVGDYLRPHQHRELLAWADEVLEGTRDGDREIARCVRLGLHLFFRQERPLTGEGSLASVEEQAAVDAELIAILERRDISPAWCQGFANHISSIMPDRLSDPLRLAIGKRSADTLRNDRPYSSIGMAHCQAVFLQGNWDTPEWSAAAQAMLDGWFHRNRFNGRSMREGLALDPSQLNILPMMEISCRLGDASLIDWHLDEFSEEWGTVPGMLISLVRAGYYRRAEQLLKRKAKDMRFHTNHYRVETRYDRRLHEAIPPFIDSLGEPDLRRFAALFLTATPDPEPRIGLDPAIPNRCARIAGVAMKNSDYQFESNQLQRLSENLLSMARTELSVSPLLGKPFAEVFDKLAPLEKQPTKDTHETYWLVHRHFFDALCQLADGKPNPGFEPKLDSSFWDRMLFKNRDNLVQRYGAEAVVDLNLYWIEEYLSKNDRESLKRILPFGRLVLERASPSVYSVDVARFQNDLLIAHAWCDEMPAFEAWWNDLAVPRKRFLTEMLYEKMALVGQAARLLNPRQEQPSDRFPDTAERRRFFRDLAANPLVENAYRRNHWVTYGYPRELLAEGDLAPVAKEIVSVSPRHGMALRDWLGVIADTEGIETALKNAEGWVLAYESKTDESESFRAAVCVARAEMALMKAALGRDEDALLDAPFIGEGSLLPESDAAIYCRQVRESIDRRFKKSP